MVIGPRLFDGDAHLNHAVLKRLEPTKVHAELFALLEVIQRHVAADLHQAQRLAAERQHAAVHHGLDPLIAAGQLFARSIVERDVRRLSAIHCAIGADGDAGVFCVHEVERDALLAVHITRRAGGYDQLVRRAAH